LSDYAERPVQLIGRLQNFIFEAEIGLPEPIISHNNCNIIGH